MQNDEKNTLKNSTLLAVDEVLDESSDTYFERDDTGDQEYYARLYGAIGDQIDIPGMWGFDNREWTSSSDSLDDGIAPMDVDPEWLYLSDDEPIGLQLVGDNEEENQRYWEQYWNEDSDDSYEAYRQEVADLFNELNGDRRAPKKRKRDDDDETPTSRKRKRNV